MYTISEIKAAFKELLMQEESVVAAWEGGSVATGFADEYSDLDLAIVIRGEDADPIFELVEQHLESRYGIQRRFRLPEPTWHGMSQCFYLTDKCPPCFYFDIAVVSIGNPHKLTESDRHGSANIWFDKEGIYNPAPSTEEDRQKLAQRVLASVQAVDFIFEIELRKALLRRNLTAAQSAWYNYLMRCLVPLLNLHYRPAKADFGIRYAEREYPLEVFERLQDLLHYDSLELIEDRSLLALEWQKELLAEL